jgi:AAA family ATP:ADP antiporter
VHRFFALNLVVFFLLLLAWPESEHPRRFLVVGRTFYVWLSVFNLFVVSVFWGFMADVFRLYQGKRLFGFIGVGGTLGAIAGSWFTGTFVKSEWLGGARLLIVSVLMLELSVWCFHRILALSTERERRVVDGAADRAPGPTVSLAATAGGPNDRPRTNVFSGMALVFQMPYLRGICLYPVFYTLSSSFLYFEQANIVADSIKGSTERTALFAHIDLFVNCLTLLMQLFATGRIVAWLGITFTLVALPLLTAVGFAALGMRKLMPALPESLAHTLESTFGIEPHTTSAIADASAIPALTVDAKLALGLWTVVIFQILFRSLNQGTAKPARETLYTVVSREVKYKSKSFIDTFIYRTGDLVGAWSFDLLHNPAMLAIGLPAIAFGTVPLGIVWLVTGLVLGRKQDELAHADAAHAAANASTPSPAIARESIG